MRKYKIHYSFLSFQFGSPIKSTHCYTSVPVENQNIAVARLEQWLEQGHNYRWVHNINKIEEVRNEQE